jgi:toxin ParE1/3/4
MGYEVVLTDDATADLQELYDHIAQFDSVQNADHVLDRLLELADTLVADPHRGSIAKEFRRLGIQDYRQVFFKPYRLVYRVLGEQVIIFLIADGRRNMQSLLSRRLLRG